MNFWESAFFSVTKVSYIAPSLMTTLPPICQFHRLHFWFLTIPSPIKMVLIGGCVQGANMLFTGHLYRLGREKNRDRWNLG